MNLTFIFVKLSLYYSSVKATQIPCVVQPLADCLQWFTGKIILNTILNYLYFLLLLNEGTSGTVQSYNNGGTGTHLTHQQYTACIRY